MKLIMILIGLVLMLVGLALAGIGLLWSGPNAALSGPFSTEPFVRDAFLPAVKPVVEGLLPLIPHAAREFLLFAENGLLPLFGALGVLVFLFGGLTLRNLPQASSRAVVRKSKEKVKSEVLKKAKEAEARQVDPAAAAALGQQAAAGAAAGGGGGGAVSMADQEKMLGGPAKQGIFDGMDEEEQLNHMVSLFHAALEKDKCEELLKQFRPRLAEFMELYREDALSALTKQALELEIIRRRRQQEDISPDQFRTFDNKITQLERETVCYRYLPARPESAPAEAREFFGLVYDRFNHSAVQQKLKSDADDWREISLRTAAEVLAEKSPARGGGGAGAAGESGGGGAEPSAA